MRFSPLEQANMFNKFFSDQFSSASNYDIDIDFYDDGKFDIDFDHRTVRKLLSNINSNKAHGPDGIHGQILKKCAVSLAFPLSKLFKLSYNMGQLPSEWKTANVVPVHKKGSKSDVENYRPISLTCLVVKTFERFIKEELLHHVSHLLDPKQHGFLANKSCTTNMVGFCDKLALALNDKLRTDVVYFDFSKAFDSVNHDIILHKLKYLYGIDGTLLKFISNYLKDRTQSVVIGNSKSCCLPVTSGVPQGSILGPILFVIFINDISKGLSSGTDVALYADDTKIWRAIHSESDMNALQDDINYLNQWATNNLMNFHPKKCKVLSVEQSHLNVAVSVPRPMQFNYYLGEKDLEYVSIENPEKDLGVLMTPNLKWNSQCNRLCTKANQQLGIVKRNAHFVHDFKRRRALYIAMVRSQFENCSIIWRPTGKSLMDKIEGIQKRAIKWIFSEEHASYGSHSVYIKKCKAANLLPMSERFCLNDMIFLHKVIHKIVPLELPYYLSFFQGQSRLRSCHMNHRALVSSVTPNIVINSSNVSGERNPVNPFHNSFFYRAHLTWNCLPIEIREIESHSLFKNELIEHLWKGLLGNDETLQEFEIDSHD